MGKFFEFFAGGGMARAGLGANWTCLFANDFDIKKAATYNANWGAGTLKVADIRDVQTTDLPERANLVWASFPCQDLSLAGAGAGLRGDRSGTFWPFWKLMESVIAEDRAPELIVLENVCGTLSSHQGKDFSAICGTYRDAGYRLGALVIDAVQFVPQSRPRLFIIGVRSDVDIPSDLISDEPSPIWHTPTLVRAFERLPQNSRKVWQWWKLPEPPAHSVTFADFVEDAPTGVRWHTPTETAKLMEMMSEVNLAKVEEAKRGGKRMVGTIYKRTRRDSYGQKVQRAEIRFDDIAGCLRTPAGGSSRQLILVVDGKRLRSRLISPRETARLMGLPDSYSLPEKYNEAYHLTGDGVVVPVVRHIAANILEPILAQATTPVQKAAA
jgi:DNA-methyltransferase (dcm)